ncbi:MAG: DUF1990 family protein, partial [Opitutaceae bacterium]
MPRINQPERSLSRPSEKRVARFLDQHESTPLSYAAVGASNEQGAPVGYNLDHNRVLLGKGEHDFAVACAALRAWRMFPPPWTNITPASAPLRKGQVVAMQAHAMGLWWLSG